MAGHTVPESDIEEVVYEIASRRKGSISAENGIGSTGHSFSCAMRAQALARPGAGPSATEQRALRSLDDPKGTVPHDLLDFAWDEAWRLRESERIRWLRTPAGRNN
jgi:hypothetical protein